MQYGVSSLSVMGQAGSVYLNFSMWAVSIVPAWLVIREIGNKYSKEKREHKNAEDPPFVDATA